jgi:hypothetical protein
MSFVHCAAFGLDGGRSLDRARSIPPFGELSKLAPERTVVQSRLKVIMGPFGFQELFIIALFTVVVVALWKIFHKR